MNDATMKAQWIAERPEKVRAVIAWLPPDTCWKSTENRGHYRPYSYDEELDGTVTVRAVHLDDSFLPGVTVFGMDPRTLEVCGCVKRSQKP